MPVVTVLRGEKGVITTNTLALAPWPVDIPATPPPPIAKATVQKPAQVAPAKPVPSLVIIGKKAETVINVPTDLPDHSGEPPQHPVTTPPPTETVPAVTKADTPQPTPAPAPKAEEKPVPAAVVAAPAPAPAVVAEQPKPAQPAEPQAKTAPEWNQPSLAKTATPPTVETAAAVPEKNLLSVRNMAIVSVTFTLLVCALLILSARNARRAMRASLITRSLDRERN
jgi:hypothetical protein